MIDDKILELINKKIDQVLTEKEQETLDKLFKQNPEFEKYCNDCVKISEQINYAIEYKHPEDLKNKIMASIDYKLYPKRKFINIFDSISHIFYQPIFRPAYMFIFGIITGILFSLIFIFNYDSEVKIDEKDFIGTIGLNSHKLTESIETVPIIADNIKGEIALKRLRKILWLQVNISSPEAYELEINYDPEILDYNNSDLAEEQVLENVKENKLQILNSGVSEYYLLFVEKIPNESLLKFRISTNGKLRFEYDIKIKN